MSLLSATRVQRSAASPGAHDELASPVEIGAGNKGRPLDAARSVAESRFGHDFGGVAVHTDSRGGAGPPSRPILARAGDRPDEPAPAAGKSGVGKMVPLIDEDLGRSTLIATGSDEFTRNYIDHNIESATYWSTAYAKTDRKYRDFTVIYQDGRQLAFNLDDLPIRYRTVPGGGRPSIRAAFAAQRYVKRHGFIYPDIYTDQTVPTLIAVASTIAFNHQQREKFLEVAEISFTFGVKILPAYAMPPEIPEGFIRRPPRIPGGLGRAASKETQVFVEIGAGDLKSSVDLARKGEGTISVIAVDPIAPAASAVKELEGAGGQFVQGVAADLKPGTADHVFSHFPYKISGTGSHVGGGTWRMVEDTVALTKPDGAAHFVTEDFETAQFLAGEANQRGMRAVITKTTAGAAAPAASGAGVPSFSKALEVWLVNIYRMP